MFVMGGSDLPPSSVLKAVFYVEIQTTRRDLFGIREEKLKWLTALVCSTSVSALAPVSAVAAFPVQRRHEHGDGRQAQTP
jgi:hypothetical protein